MYELKFTKSVLTFLNTKCIHIQNIINELILMI